MRSANPANVAFTLLKMAKITSPRVRKARLK
jgi:hypothetical protein